MRTRAASTAVARAVSRACTERRAELRGSVAAARALVGAAQRRARWVPRSGAGRLHEPRVFDVRLEFIVNCILRIKITRKPQPENYVTSTWPPAPYRSERTGVRFPLGRQRLIIV